MNCSPARAALSMLAAYFGWAAILSQTWSKYSRSSGSIRRPEPAGASIHRHFGRTQDVRAARRPAQRFGHRLGIRLVRVREGLDLRPVRIADLPDDLHAHG